MRSAYILVAIFLASLTPTVSARSNVGTVWGRLTVVEGRGPIEGAVVKLVRESGGQSIEVTADEKGRFARAGLPPGTYVATISREGFASVEVFGIVLRQGRRVRLDVELTPIDEAPFERERRQFRPPLVDPEGATVEYTLP
jgi:hypothetical protein